MIEAALLYLVELLPVLPEVDLSVLGQVAPYTAWLGMFIDYSFLGTIIGLMFLVELGVDVALLIMRAIELIPGF